MTVLLAIYKYLFPFVLGMLSLLLYRKQYRFMRKFYWRMTLYWKARKFYILVIYAHLLLYSYTFYVADGISIGIALSSVFMLPLVFFRMADKWLHRLHEYAGKLLLLVFLAVVIAPASGMVIALVTMLTVGVTAMFYPSEHILRLCSDPKYYKDIRLTMGNIVEHYYGRPDRHPAYSKKHLARNNHRNYKNENQ